MRILCGTILALLAALSAHGVTDSRLGDHGDVLARFYSENDGKSLRRLPSWIVPENAFDGFGISDPSNVVQRRLLELYRDRSDWNVLTYCCRSSEPLNPAVTSRLAMAASELRGTGIELLMELDPRLLRNAFLERLPDDYLRLRQYGVFSPAADGSAKFEVRQDYMCDYENVGGMKDPYSGWKPGRLLSARAAKGESMRPISAADVTCSPNAVLTVAGEPLEVRTYSASAGFGKVIIPAGTGGWRNLPQTDP